MSEYLTQSYAQRQSALEAAKANFFAAGGSITVGQSFSYVPKPAPIIKKRSAREPCPRIAATRQAAQEKRDFAMKVMEMAKTMTQRDISEALGVSRKTLFNLGNAYGFSYMSGKEQGIAAIKQKVIDPERDATLIERIKAFKEIGLTRTQAYKKLGISNSAFLRLITDYEINYPKATQQNLASSSRRTHE